MRQDKFRGNVFVANLPQGFTDERLAARFGPYRERFAEYL